MNNFNVLTLGEFIAGEESKIAILAFSEFYHGVTAKHQKRSKLILIEQDDMLPDRQLLIKDLELTQAVKIVSIREQEEIELHYKKASMFLLPSFQKVGNVMVEALSFGLPILTYDHPNHDEYVDHTCGMVVQHISKAQSIQEFGARMHMLYFDPEARKILRKGALSKHQSQFTWGSHRQRSY